MQVANAHNQMQLTPDELQFIADHPRQVHKLLSLSIPDPAEHIGVRREQDVASNGAPGNGRENGSKVPWCEVAPNRLLR